MIHTDPIPPTRPLTRPGLSEATTTLHEPGLLPPYRYFGVKTQHSITIITPAYFKKKLFLHWQNSRVANPTVETGMVTWSQSPPLKQGGGRSWVTCHVTSGVPVLPRDPKYHRHQGWITPQCLTTNTRAEYTLAIPNHCIKWVGQGVWYLSQVPHPFSCLPTSYR